MEERDFETNPYSKDEERVAEYLRSVIPEIGTGDDPLGFLIASHMYLRGLIQGYRERFHVEHEPTLFREMIER